MLLLYCHCFHPATNPSPIRETAAKRARLVNQSLKYPLAIRIPLNLTHPSPSYGPLLQTCSEQRFLHGGLQLHAHMIKTGSGADHHLQLSLLHLYLRCRTLGSARRVFDTGTLTTSVASWNSIITALCQSGSIQEAASMFLELQRSGLQPDSFTLSTLVGIVHEQDQLRVGNQLHSLSIKFGYGEEEFVCNSLIQMYAAFGRIDDSLHLFDRVSDEASAVTWNSMIARLVDNELYGGALELYTEMQGFGVEPTHMTLGSVLRSCAALKSTFEGRTIHAQVIIRGFLPNVIIQTALIDFYSKCGQLENGARVFKGMEERNIFTWNSMIRGYSQMGYREEALKLLQKMRKEEIVPDKFTFPALLTGAIIEEDHYPRECRSIHAHIIKAGLETDHFIATSLITMYSRNQCLEEARLVFEDAGSVEIGVCSSMLSAYVKNGEGEEALKLFTAMLRLGIRVNSFIFSSLFTACGNLSDVETGKQIHGYSLRSCHNYLDTAANNSLIAMYSDCGLIEEAGRVFDSIDDLNVVSFNSMISALAQHGLPREASQLFGSMELASLKPDGITLLNLLVAFNHAGLVSQGLKLFNSMEETHGIAPTYQHCACVVDMLARAGDIEQAVALINDMPFEPEPSLWRLVLGACSKHKNIAIGTKVAELLEGMEPNEATNYLLLANTYARLGRWTDADRIRGLMEEKGLEKEQGVSWIEIKRRTYTFGVADRSHPRSDEIYEKLSELMNGIKMAGYRPDISFTLHGMQEERREESLWYHSEKLACAFGVLSTGEGVKLRIMKNLRICGDCHCAYKYFSLITGREITLRDNYRFHHFSRGVCSCGDYW